MNHFDMCLLSHRKIVVLKTTIYHYNFIPKAVKKMAQIKKKSVLSILLPRFLGIVQYITAILSYNHFCTFFAEFRAKYSNYNKLFWII